MDDKGFGLYRGCSHVPPEVSPAGPALAEGRWADSESVQQVATVLKVNGTDMGPAPAGLGRRQRAGMIVAPTAPCSRKSEEGPLLCALSLANQPASGGEGLGAPAERPGAGGGSCRSWFLNRGLRAQSVTVRTTWGSLALVLHGAGAAHPLSGQRQPQDFPGPASQGAGCSPGHECHVPPGVRSREGAGLGLPPPVLTAVLRPRPGQQSGRCHWFHTHGKRLAPWRPSGRRGSPTVLEEPGSQSCPRHPWSWRVFSVHTTR